MGKIFQLIVEILNVSEHDCVGYFGDSDAFDTHWLYNRDVRICQK